MARMEQCYTNGDPTTIDGHSAELNVDYHDRYRAYSYLLVICILVDVVYYFRKTSMAMLFCYNTMALTEKPSGKWEREVKGFTMTMTSITTVAFDIV